MTRRSEYGTGLDVAIMIPGVEPAFEAGEAQPIDLEFVAQMVDVPTKALFAVRGYPKGSGIDYDQFEIARDSFALLGGYDGPMRGFPGCHSLRASSAMVGGPDGLSGSPVARVLRRQDGSWAAALAGMVVMGGPERLHFVEVGTIMGVLKSASNSQR